MRKPKFLIVLNRAASGSIANNNSLTVRLYGLMNRFGIDYTCIGESDPVDLTQYDVAIMPIARTAAYTGNGRKWINGEKAIPVVAFMGGNAAEMTNAANANVGVTAASGVAVGDYKTTDRAFRTIYYQNGGGLQHCTANYEVTLNPDDGGRVVSIIPSVDAAGVPTGKHIAWKRYHESGNTVWYLSVASQLLMIEYALEAANITLDQKFAVHIHLDDINDVSLVSGIVQPGMETGLMEIGQFLDERGAVAFGVINSTDTFTDEFKHAVWGTYGISPFLLGSHPHNTKDYTDPLHPVWRVGNPKSLWQDDVHYLKPDDMLEAHRLRVAELNRLLGIPVTDRMYLLPSNTASARGYDALAKLGYGWVRSPQGNDQEVGLNGEVSTTTMKGIGNNEFLWVYHEGVKYNTAPPSIDLGTKYKLRGVRRYGIEDSALLYTRYHTSQTWADAYDESSVHATNNTNKDGRIRQCRYLEDRVLLENMPVLAFHGTNCQHGTIGAIVADNPALDMLTKLAGLIDNSRCIKWADLDDIEALGR